MWFQNWQQRWKKKTLVVHSYPHLFFLGTLRTKIIWTEKVSYPLFYQSFIGNQTPKKKMQRNQWLSYNEVPHLTMQIVAFPLRKSAAHQTQKRRKKIKELLHEHRQRIITRPSLTVLPTHWKWTGKNDHKKKKKNGGGTRSKWNQGRCYASWRCEIYKRSKVKYITLIKMVCRTTSPIHSKKLFTHTHAHAKYIIPFCGIKITAALRVFFLSFFLSFFPQQRHVAIASNSTFGIFVGPKRACRYGFECYRKNPDHFREFSHPICTTLFKTTQLKSNVFVCFPLI